MTLAEHTPAGVKFQVEGPQSSRTASLDVSNASELSAFVDSISSHDIYLDVTALPLVVWAPLLRELSGRDGQVWAMYAEPNSYRFRSDRVETDIFELSRPNYRVAPVPGFAVLSEADGSSTTLVVLLGFEGPRLQNILQQASVRDDRTYPLVGLPGFEPDYPFHTLLANGAALRQSESWKNIRYAAANSVSDAYYELLDVGGESQPAFMKVAPLGTRPHQLAAVLFVLQHPSRAELIYDHPVELPERSIGIGPLHVYNISAALSIPTV